LRYTRVARRSLHYWSSTQGHSSNGYKHFTDHSGPTSKFPKVTVSTVYTHSVILTLKYQNMVQN